MKEVCLTCGPREDRQSKLLPMSLQVEKGTVELDIRSHHGVT